MKGAIIKCKDTLERCYGATSHSCTVATMLDPLFRLGYYSVRYDEDPNKNVDPGDILRIARHIYTSGYKTSALDVASAEPQSFIPNEFGSGMFKKPRTAVVTSINEFYIYMLGAQEGHMTQPLLWWKSQEKKFPTLAKMAMDYLAIPGTSASRKIFLHGKPVGN